MQGFIQDYEQDGDQHDPQLPGERSFRGDRPKPGSGRYLLRGTTSNIGGIRLEEIAADAIAMHNDTFSHPTDSLLEHKGIYSFRKDGEKHAWNPDTISMLQLATRLGSYKKFKEYSHVVDEKESPIFLRDFLTFKQRTPIPLEQVEPEEAIMRRFVTGAMSFGSISREAHETIAIAMNKIHGRSNTGEGGEDSARFIPP